MDIESHPAPSEIACAPFGSASYAIADYYGEELQAAGTTEGGNVLLMALAAPNGRAFTVVAVGSDGVACFLAQGENRRSARPARRRRTK